MGFCSNQKSNRLEQNDLTSMDPADTLRALSSQSSVLGEYDQLIKGQLCEGDSGRLQFGIADFQTDQLCSPYLLLLLMQASDPVLPAAQVSIF